MKNLLFLFTVILFLISCQKKETPQVVAPENNQINFGQIDTIYSEILDENREVWIHAPRGSFMGSETNHPVLYLLDGPAHFYSVVGMVDQLSNYGNTKLPEMIIVAIRNTDRTRDLTPTHSMKSPFSSDASFLKNSGGGEKFNDFIEKELIPYIDKNYATTPYRTYIGHSFGGLAVINTLLTRPYLFDNYIAIDPSLWWDDQLLLKKSETLLDKEQYENKSLYLGIANTLADNIEYETRYKDTTEFSIHMKSILQFANKVDSFSDNGFQFDWKYYKDDSHNSVPLITEYDGLRFLFSWHDFKGLNTLYAPDAKISKEDLLNILNNYSKTLTKHFGYEILPNEDLVNRLGYMYLGQEKYDLSFAAFELNIQNYPNNTNVYDSMGDYYLGVKDSLKALDLFNKALEVGDNNFSQDKIDMLKENLNL